VKVGIVVPYSWSFWGGVQEHADHQARALRALGVEAKILMGHDPPGRLSWLLHPKQGRHTSPPDYVVPVGRSVIVPANASLPNIILSPPAMLRMRRAWEEERFDIVHVHEPLAPVLSAFALATAPCPLVVTCHSAGERLSWYSIGRFLFSVLIERIDYRIAVSESARRAADRFGIGLATAIRWVRQVRETGDRTPGRQGQPRRSKLDPHRDYILRLVETTPDMTISEMLEKLAEERGVQASRATLWTFLDRCGLTFKKSPRTRPSRTVRAS